MCGWRHLWESQALCKFTKWKVIKFTHEIHLENFPKDHVFELWSSDQKDDSFLMFVARMGLVEGSSSGIKWEVKKNCLSTNQVYLNI